MHPIRALVLKEIRQHCWALVSLTVSLAAALAVLLWNASREERLLSLLQPAYSFLVLFVPAAALVLGHRLVVQEYTGSTEKFLEGLPISRLQMVSTKFFFGFAYLIGAALAGLGICAHLATATEPIEARFLAILILKTMSIVFFAWALFFVMGFTGRFRIPIYIGLFFLFAYLLNSTDFDPTRVGPIALIEADKFVSERDESPGMR